jgi:hypothetical protein
MHAWGICIDDDLAFDEPGEIISGIIFIGSLGGRSFAFRGTGGVTACWGRGITTAVSG